MGKQVTVRQYRYYRPFAHTFWGTILWVLPGMAILLLVGFLIGRDYFAPRFLEPSEVRTSHREPVRILSPQEAQQEAHDTPSDVWTRGVQPSDIPKMEGDDSRQTGRSSRHRRSRRSSDQANQPSTTPTSTPSAAPGSTGTTPAPSAPPAAPSTPAPAPAENTGNADTPQD